MNERSTRPLWMHVAVAVVAPFFLVLPGWYAELPAEPRKPVRWALAAGVAAWVAVLWGLT